MTSCARRFTALKQYRSEYELMHIAVIVKEYRRKMASYLLLGSPRDAKGMRAPDGSPQDHNYFYWGKPF
jgi:hypothetical protein